MWFDDGNCLGSRFGDGRLQLAVGLICGHVCVKLEAVFGILNPIGPGGDASS